MPGVARVETAEDVEGLALWVFGNGDRTLAPEIAELARAENWRLTTIRVERIRLDDVFRAVTPHRRWPRRKRRCLEVIPGRRCASSREPMNTGFR